MLMMMTVMMIIMIYADDIDGDDDDYASDIMTMMMTMLLQLHRRTIQDDVLGVGEKLDELGVNRKGLILRGDVVLVTDSTRVDS